MLHALPVIVFIRLTLGAALHFTPDPSGRPSFRPQWIALSFWAMVATTSRAALAPEWAVAIGIAGLIGSLALFQWAAHSIRGRMFSYVFSRDVPQFLHTSGPYAYVRNPFYASYLLAIVATLIMWPSVPGAIVAAAMAAYFEAAARFEERKFETSALQAEYQVYKARTGRLLPRLRVRHTGASASP